ncbi:MAG TPA: SGNH/GDSL hydrolase family protein [Gemmatimonadaceae bacterium]
MSRRYTMWNLADTSDVDRAEGIMMGDSITAPYIGNLPTICAYIYTLQESRTRPGILMHAAPGYTISQQYAIWTSPTLNPYATNSMVKWASLQLGINNAGNAGGSQTEAQMATDMQTFVNRINSDIPSAKVLLIPNTPCRAGGAAGLSDAQWAQLSAFNNDLLGTGAHPITGSNIVRMPLWSAMDDGTGTLQSWANSGDGVHITAAARQYEAAAIRLTLQQNGLL